MRNYSLEWKKAKELTLDIFKRHLNRYYITINLLICILSEVSLVCRIKRWKLYQN